MDAHRGERREKARSTSTVGDMKAIQLATRRHLRPRPAQLRNPALVVALHAGAQTRGLRADDGMVRDRDAEKFVVYPEGGIGARGTPATARRERRGEMASTSQLHLTR